MKTNIGKNTLGDSNKMSVYLHEYGRSTHNLSYAWRSTMGVGTLVPFMKQLALPGDTWDIALDEKVLTHPTVGPLFGNYKLQMDVFTCPIRLYNAMLHNNTLNIGLDMAKVKLPKFEFVKHKEMAEEGNDEYFRDFNRSSIYSYLGLKNITASNTVETFNAIPFLAYLDIFKNYYANKQEEDFFVIIPEDNGTAASEYTGNIENFKENGNVVNYNIGMIFKETTEEEAKNLYKNYTGTIPVKSADGSKLYNIQYPILSESDYNNTLIAINIGGDNWNVYINNYTGKILNNDDFNGEGLTYNAIATPIEPDKREFTIKNFKLTDIDEIREYILSKGKQEVILGEKQKETNIEILDWYSGKSGNNNGRKLRQGNLGGLILKTHKSDLFNNWINTEWIDGENGIKGITAIDTSSGSFTIDTLNLAQKVYNMLNRIAVSGGTYKDWIETVYTTDYYFRAETPIYEGGMSATIDFAEVVSNSAAENEPLGTLAGRGFANNKKGGRLKIKINEPCYIIGIVSITPNVDYSQGNDWDMMYLNTMNDLHKPELDGIGYQDLMTRLLDGRTHETDSIGKTVAWINYMTNFNKTFANFAVGGNESFMVLNRIYEIGSNEKLKNATTYINPKDYTYIFAENSIYNQDFWVQIGCGIEARRVMSAKQIPIM